MNKEGFSSSGGRKPSNADGRGSDDLVSPLYFAPYRPLTFETVESVCLLEKGLPSLRFLSLGPFPYLFLAVETLYFVCVCVCVSGLSRTVPTTNTYYLYLYPLPKE